MNARQGAKMGPRWVDLYQLTLEEFDQFEEYQAKFVSTKLPSRTELLELKDKVVILRGLPFNAEIKDVLAMFKEYNLNEEQVTIEVRNGKKTGYGVVNVGDGRHSRAKRELNKFVMGHRYIEVLLVMDYL